MKQLFNILLCAQVFLLFSCKRNDRQQVGDVQKQLSKQAALDFVKKDYGASLSIYLNAIAANPDKIFNYAGAGYTYLYLQRKDSAYYYFNVAVQKDPGFHEGLGALAMLAYDAGKTEDFNRYIKLAIGASQKKIAQSPAQLSNKMNYLFYNALLFDKAGFNQRVPDLMQEAGLQAGADSKALPYLKIIEQLKNMNRDAFISRFANPNTLYKKVY